MTATIAGPELRERLNALLSRMPGYPHRTLDVRVNAKKEGTRLRKIVCPACGYTARTTRQWLDKGKDPVADETPAASRGNHVSPRRVIGG